MAVCGISARILRMTTELHIPIANNAVLAFWQAQAALHGRSVEEEIADLLSKAASKNRIEEKFAVLREKIRTQCGVLPDSTQLIREDRDA